MPPIILAICQSYLILNQILKNCKIIVDFIIGTHQSTNTFPETCFIQNAEHHLILIILIPKLPVIANELFISEQDFQVLLLSYIFNSYLCFEIARSLLKVYLRTISLSLTPISNDDWNLQHSDFLKDCQHGAWFRSKDKTVDCVCHDDGAGPDKGDDDDDDDDLEPGHHQWEDRS